MNEFLRYRLAYHKTLTMRHHGACYLRGVSTDLQLYAEEIYGEDDLLARYVFHIDGTMLAYADETEIPYTNSVTLLPPAAHRPTPPTHTRALNFDIGLRRGQREPERIQEIVPPLKIQEKMEIVKAAALAILPPLLFGLTESTVLAEAPLYPPQHYLVCRRLRLAYGLPQPKRDTRGLLYDYDSAVLHIVHAYQVGVTPSLTEALSASKTLLPGVALCTPLDCLSYQDYIFVADGGDTRCPAAVHVWKREEN
ncbi:MAG: hypothetical protein HXY40_06310 [Chloroflexi bacterium]|nr:hypothetical protein [Chloroflexota bacterium]